MTVPTHEAIEADLAAYVTGGLEPAAQAQVAHHLASCPRCRQTVREYETVLALVPLGLPEAAPPPGAQERLLARARSEGGSAVLGGRSRWRSINTRLAGAVAVALALVLALLGGVALQQRTTPASPRVVTLAGSELAPNATGLLALSVGDAELTVAGLPPLPPGRTYQLWFVQPDAARQSGGLFTVNAQGQGSLAVSIPGPMSSFVRVGITEEPAGGSPGPTGPALLAGDL